ncbi:hypothetical protein [Leifsonia sp. Leaf264]|uniref:hypothetical protein n=1 Tax=Leifsonia sp. Leaf264 TaxID=1736314 RepID=UPI0006FDE76C|nr:hypothetical protein [Leifsonia sp. Leaf264]KQO98776.1 hypothetical protein ASF30_11990 [Leifsonia sp. Leaf264]
MTDTIDITTDEKTAKKAKRKAQRRARAKRRAILELVVAGILLASSILFVVQIITGVYKPVSIEVPAPFIYVIVAACVYGFTLTGRDRRRY